MNFAEEKHTHFLSSRKNSNHIELTSPLKHNPYQKKHLPLKFKCIQVLLEVDVPIAFVKVLTMNIYQGVNILKASCDSNFKF